METLTLRQLREDLGKTQKDVAEALGVSQASVSRIERRTNIKLSTLRRYVIALGGKLEVKGLFPDNDTWRAR